MTTNPGLPYVVYIGVNISERKSGTETTKKRKKRESVLFSPPGGAIDTAVLEYLNKQRDSILEVGQPGNFLPMMLSAPRQPRERV